jgi:hypothetical protein
LQIIFEHAVSRARYVSGDRIYRFILSAKTIIGARVQHDGLVCVEVGQNIDSRYRAYQRCL